MNLPANGTSRNPIGLSLVVGLLAAILIALGVLIGILLKPPPGGGGEDFPAKKTYPEPETINQPARIRETAQQGKTYHSILKAGLTARCEDKRWGLKTLANVVFQAEFVVNRTIEKNDGKTIVELRYMEKARSVLVLCDAESVSLDLGLPNELVLGILDGLLNRAHPALGDVSAILKGFVERESKWLMGRYLKGNASAFTNFQTLEGKRARITYVDGKGVTGVVAVDENGVRQKLSPEEDDFLWRTSTLSDYYIMPDKEIKVGGTWALKAQHLSILLDPSWNAHSTGTMTMVREDDLKTDGKHWAKLHVQNGVMEMESNDKANSRVGTFVPRGDMYFDLKGGFVREAKLTGDIKFEQLSKDHLLFQSHFRTEPKLELTYWCEMK